jgi:diguanylate cyclase (GGDEF)-like protein
LAKTLRLRLRLHNFATFSVLSAILFLLIAVGIDQGARAITRARVINGIERQANNLAHFSIEPQLTSSPLAGQMDRLKPVEQAMGTEMERGFFLSLRVFDVNNKLVETYDPNSVTKGFTKNQGLSDDVSGDVSTVVFDKSPNREGGRYLRVFVPLHANRSARTVGTLELTLPYNAVKAAVDADSRKLFWVVLAGLAILYGALLRISRRASNDLQQKVAENQYQALHDVLTGLPNRGVFRDRVRQALAQAHRDKTIVAVMLMDLDRFKEINDTLGHHHGDLLLQQIGPRLQSVLRETDTVARLGGDEFAVLLPGLNDAAAAIHVADKMRGVLKRNFLVGELTLHVDASVGIALHPGHGNDVDTLLQRADVAMYMAKAAGTGREVYTADKDEHSPTRLALIGELRQAIDAGQLILHYQPKVDLMSGDVVGVEALVRWDHPTRGFLPPGVFVPLSEHTGLIEPMTLKILDQALKQSRDWDNAGFPLKMSVNLSVRNLLDPQLPGKIEHMLQKWGVPANRLELELTETSIMQDPRRASGCLDALHALGVRIAIDDFGTGYSSLFYLKRLPISVLKIDKSFILNMPSNDNDAAIVRSIIDLAHNLGIEVVAEGVETEEVRNHLRALGCDLSQGYYHGRPIPAEDLTWSLSLATLGPEAQGVNE